MYQNPAESIAGRMENAANTAEKAAKSIATSIDVSANTLREMRQRIADEMGLRNELERRVTQLEALLGSLLSETIDADAKAIVEALKRLLASDPDVIASALRDVAKKAVAA